MLVAAMNPCPCGFAGASAARLPLHAAGRSQQYAARLSGPLRDRIDLSADLPAVPLAALTFERQRRGDDGAGARPRRRGARAPGGALRRHAASVAVNGALAGPRHPRGTARSTPPARRLLAQAADRLGLSARAHDRVLRVARTIADLRWRDAVTDSHVGRGAAVPRLVRRQLARLVRQCRGYTL